MKKEQIEKYWKPVESNNTNNLCKLWKYEDKFCKKSIILISLPVPEMRLSTDFSSGNLPHGSLLLSELEYFTKILKEMIEKEE